MIVSLINSRNDKLSAYLRTYIVRGIIVLNIANVFRQKKTIFSFILPRFLSPVL